MERRAKILVQHIAMSTENCYFSGLEASCRPAQITWEEFEDNLIAPEMEAYLKAFDMDPNQAGHVNLDSNPASVGLPGLLRGARHLLRPSL